jgi:hypothetical protein
MILEEKNKDLWIPIKFFGSWLVSSHFLFIRPRLGKAPGSCRKGVPVTVAKAA